jgi:hypothetical protein
MPSSLPKGHRERALFTCRRKSVPACEARSCQWDASYPKGCETSVQEQLQCNAPISLRVLAKHS